MAVYMFATGSEVPLNHIAGGWAGGFPPGNLISIILTFQLCFIDL